MRRSVLGICLVPFAIFACSKTEDPPVATTGPTTVATPSPTPAAPATPESKMDKDMAKVIEKLGTLGGKPIESLTADEARKQPTPADAVKALLQADGKSTAPEEVGKVEDKTFPAGTGTLPARIYTPNTGKAPYPLVVYYHGGGFVIANNDVYDATPRALANATEAVVVSLDYRRAPESKFPAAHDDAYAGYLWAVRGAAALGADPKKVALVGESAGGNLAANVALKARAAKETAPLYAVLVYPVASSNMGSASYLEQANAKPLNKPMMKWFTDNYFRTPADANDPRINLVGADLTGMPPTTIINAEIDPLRSDGEQLAARLKEAGVTVEQKTYAGVTHEFFGMGAVVSDAKDAVELAAKRLKAAFTK